MLSTLMVIHTYSILALSVLYIYTLIVWYFKRPVYKVLKQLEFFFFSNIVLAINLTALGLDYMCKSTGASPTPNFFFWVGIWPLLGLIVLYAYYILSEYRKNIPDLE